MEVGLKFHEAIKAMMEDGRVVESCTGRYRFQHGNFQSFVKGEINRWFDITFGDKHYGIDFTLVEEPKPVKRVPVVAIKTNLKSYAHDPFFIRLDRELQRYEEKFPLKFDPATGECYVEIGGE